ALIELCETELHLKAFVLYPIAVAAPVASHLFPMPEVRFGRRRGRRCALRSVFSRALCISGNGLASGSRRRCRWILAKNRSCKTEERRHENRRYYRGSALDVHFVCSSIKKTLIVHSRLLFGIDFARQLVR